MNQVLVLEVQFDFGNGLNSIYPVILKDKNDMVLIDCGYPNFLQHIKEVADKIGINLNELTKIVITHHDFDHMGAVSEFKSEYPNISIVCSDSEEKYISGKEKSLRLQQAEALYDFLPEDQKAEAEKFHSLLKSVESVNVDLLVKDHDIFPWCGGTEIIATPGHMPGHISLYLKETKTLIAGDAVVVENNQIEIANPNYTLDMKEAKKSVEKLINYEVEKIICYHGGIYTKEIKASLQKLI